jgi:hypothetical protein
MSTLRFTTMPYILEDETSKNAMNQRANDILQIVSNNISCFTMFIVRFGPSSTQTAESILAPASKPYCKAIKSYEEKLEGLRNLDRSLRTVVYSSTRTSIVASFINEDAALLKLKANRAANNNLEHGPGYNDYIWCTGGASYPKKTTRYRYRGLQSSEIRRSNGLQRGTRGTINLRPMGT